MRKIIVYSIFIVMVASINAQEITGNWTGNLNVMGTKLRIGFTIAKKDSVYISKMDSPDQGALGLPTSRTSFMNDTLRIDAGGMGIKYTAIFMNDSLVGTFAQSGLTVPLTLKRADRDSLNRPQHPTAPFPYKSEEVKFSNKEAEIVLSGTLTLPDTAGPHPAVILIAGSGHNDRDETIFGHKPFLVIADYLTRNGFAVLRYDKRGVGQSGGRYETATTRHFADDAKVALEFLRTRNEIDKSNIGVVGHSEGGIIAPILASEDKNIKFIVLLAGMGVKGIDLLMAQNEISLKSQNMEPENMERILNMTRDTFESLLQWEGTEANRVALNDRVSQMWDQLPILAKMKQKKEVFVRNQFNAMSTPWTRYFLAIDPTTYLKKVKCPVLAINGDKDIQVSAEKDLTAIKHALEQGGNFRVQTKVYPGLNHLFQECETGMPDEYAKIEQTFSPQVLEDITHWMKPQLTDIR